jgi:hypothetical protein
VQFTLRAACLSKKTPLKIIKSSKNHLSRKKHLKHNIHTLKLGLSVGRQALNLREIRREHIPHPSVFFPA